MNNLFEEYEEIRELKQLIGKRFKWSDESCLSNNPPFTITHIGNERFHSAVCYMYDDEWNAFETSDYFKKHAIAL